MSSTYSERVFGSGDEIWRWDRISQVHGAIRLARICDPGPCTDCGSVQYPEKESYLDE